MLKWCNRKAKYDKKNWNFQYTWNKMHHNTKPGARFTNDLMTIL